MLSSLELQIWRLFWSRSSLTFRQTIECGISLKLVRDMIIIYSQMYRTEKYSQRSSIVLPVWLNGWVFVYELSGYRFEITLLSIKLQIWGLLQASGPLTFRKATECGFTLKLVRDMIIRYSQMHRADKFSQHSSIIWPVWLSVRSSVLLWTKSFWFPVQLQSFKLQVLRLLRARSSLTFRQL